MYCTEYNSNARLIGLCTIEAADTVHLLVDDSDPEKRRRTVDVRDWWFAAVERELEKRRMKRKDLAEVTGADQPEITRCLHEDPKKRKPVFEIVIAISDALTLPYPIILPDSEEEAVELAKQRRVMRRLQELERIAAGVGESPTEDQIRTLQPEHAIRKRQRRRAGSKEKPASR